MEIEENQYKDYIAGKQSSFVPNSFQTPNAFVDFVMSYLTGDEYKVLIYATRRILGFQKRQDRISLSQFTVGTKNKKGEYFDKGTGLGVETVKKCLASLVSFGLMVRLSENDPKTNEGTLWSLQWDGRKVAWEALEERGKNKKQLARSRIFKARSMRQTPLSGTEGGCLSDTERPPLSGTETQYTEETQGNQDIINNPASELFRSYFGKFYGPEQERWQMLYEEIGQVRAQEIIEWAFKKEIHLTNRGSLLESLRTTAKNWKTKKAPKLINSVDAGLSNWLASKGVQPNG